MASAFIAKAVVVGAVAVAGWGLAKLVSSLASGDQEDEKTKDNGNWIMGNYQIPRNQFDQDSPYHDYYNFPDENVDEIEKRFESYEILPYNVFEDSHESDDDELAAYGDRPYRRPWTELQAARSEVTTKGKRKICWRFPAGSRKLKLNTDGSVKWRSKQKDGSVRYINPRRAGFGGVIRDEKGSFIVGFYGRLKDGCEVLEAELWGIYKGLEIIQARNLRKVEIQSDSQAAVYLIENETAYMKSRFKELAEKCKAMKLEMGCTLGHALRETNRVADKLAKQGRDRYNYDFITFTTPPKQIINCLLADFKLANSFVADAHA